MPNKEKLAKSSYKKDLESMVKMCEAIRKDTEDPQEISLGEFIKKRYSGLTMEQLYEDLGLNPSVDTIQNIVNLPDNSLRWLIPEIFRDALRLGLRKNPIYKNLIAAEQSVSQLQVTMPAINMSEAKPHKVGIAETITTGELSFDQKQVRIYKYGRGIKVPYEVIQYVPLNLVAIFLQDFGVKLGMGIDTMCISTILNGDQVNGTDSVAVLGVGTAATLAYRDALRIWVRGSRLGKNFTTMIAGEDMAMDLLDLFTSTRFFGTQRTTIDIKTPLPQNANVFVHGAIPASQVAILDTSSALIKLNAQPLLVETDKIISNQTQETYATLTTGFATIYRDSRLVMDKSRAFSTYGFPTFMDPTAQEQIQFE